MTTIKHFTALINASSLGTRTGRVGPGGLSRARSDSGPSHSGSSRTSRPSASGAATRNSGSSTAPSPATAAADPLDIAADDRKLDLA